MDAEHSTADQRARDEQEQLSARGMRVLTGGLTSEGDAFLIGVAAVVLMVALYPLIDAWSLLAFPVVFIGAVIARRRRRRALSR
jgi:hypothetical protein